MNPATSNRTRARGRGCSERCAVGVAALLLVTACSGQSASPGLTPRSASARTAQLTIRVAVPPPAAAARRAPKFVSPNVSSIAVAISSGSATASPAQTGNCASSSCAVTVDAPIGADTLAVSLYDAPNGGGKLLSSGVASATVAAGANTTVVVTFDPVVASTSIALGTQLASGTSGSVSAVLSALDPDGATITAPGSFEHADGSPLTLAVGLSDPNGGAHVRLTGQTSESAPSTSASAAPLAVAYDGTPVNFGYPSIVVKDASAGTILSSTVVPIAPHASGDSTPLAIDVTVTSTAFDQSGNLWFTGSSFSNGSGTKAEYGRYVPSTGAVTVYPLADAAANPDSLVAAADGDLYFFEHGTETFAQISSTGTLREFPFTSDARDLTLGVDGKAWFATETTAQVPQAEIGSIATSGAVATYPVNSPAHGLTAGPQGKMWYIATGELGSIASDGTAGTTIPITGFDTAATSAGLVYGPGGRFYTNARTDYGGDDVFAVTTGGAATGTCASGTFRAVLSDGALFYGDAGTRLPIDSFSAIRPDGTCVSLSVPAPSIAEAFGFVEPVSSGHAYVFGGGVLPFVY